MDNRLMIFIDAEYVVQKIKEHNYRRRVTRKDIRWNNIIEWICNRRHLVRCYYYSAEFDKDTNPQTYKEQHDMLRDLKLTIPYFDVKLGRLVQIGQTWVQKGLDVKIAVDMYSKAASDQYDIAAIVTGDSDFVEVIQEIKERFGKHMELITFDQSVYDALRRAPDRHIIVDSHTAQKFKFFQMTPPPERHQPRGESETKPAS